MRWPLQGIREQLNRIERKVDVLLSEQSADAEQVTAEVLGRVQPLLTQFEGAVKVAVEQAGPGVQITVAGLVEKLLADAAKIAF